VGRGAGGTTAGGGAGTATGTTTGTATGTTTGGATFATADVSATCLGCGATGAAARPPLIPNMARTTPVSVIPRDKA
jgi:hypothetical protein